MPIDAVQAVPLRRPVLEAGTRVRTHAAHFGLPYARERAKKTLKYKKLWWKASVEGKVVADAHHGDVPVDWKQRVYLTTAAITRASTISASRFSSMRSSLASRQ